MTRVVELRSDTFTLPTPTMREAMASAPLGDDVYGEDPTVAALERKAAALLGKPAACFMPSGTMGNLAAILAACPHGTKVIVGCESDIYVYEAGGASACGGVIYHPLPQQPDGSIALDDLASAFPVDSHDPQFALPALLCLENPSNRCGGQVLPVTYLDRVAELALTRDIPVHLDGARIFNAALASGVPVSRIAATAHTVQFCLSKGLCAPAGSVVVGPEETIASVRRVRKMLGGGMRQVGVLAAAGIIALDHMVDRLPIDHTHACRLSDGLRDVPGVRLVYDSPQTNMVFFRVEQLDVNNFITEAGLHGVNVATLGHGRIRAVTHAGVTAEDIDYALEVFTEVMIR